MEMEFTARFTGEGGTAASDAAAVSDTGDGVSLGRAP